MQELKNRLNEKEFNNEFTYKLLDAEKIFNQIFEVCGNEMEYGCGSYLIGSEKYEYSIKMYPKQKLIYDKTKNISSVLEIGTYMGHSLLLMLLANPDLDITCIDIEDKYSEKVTKYLQTIFPKAKIKFLKGNSLKILPNITNNFDFFHVDGAHGNTIITKEFMHCKRLSSSNDFKLIFDDVDVCKTLQDNINLSYNVVDSFIPNCVNKNKFCQIKISSDITIRENQDKKFKYNVAKSFIKEFPSRLTRFFIKKIKNN
jgi:hypothetical protein